MHELAGETIALDYPDVVDYSTNRARFEKGARLFSVDCPFASLIPCPVCLRDKMSPGATKLVILLRREL